MRKTKIVCTIGPASESQETLEKLVNAGMNVARINFSHGDYEEQKYRIENIKKIREKLNKPVALMLDTKGPEIRIGKFKDGKIILKEGDLFTLVNEDILGDQEKVSVTYKNLSDEIDIGTTILINDGLIECKVEKIKDKDVTCIVINGGKLTDRKSINIPNSKINLPSLTQKDIGDIEFGVKNQFDYIAASFIRKPQDVLDIKEILKEFGGENIKVIAKIENREGVDNFDKILAVSDGIMVARGDLGVEVPMEEVPILQKEFIQKCCLAGKPVITATQMLESMVNSPRPTRAEVSDVANAVYDQTGSIMLSAETAAGKYPVECVQTMDKIAKSIETDIKYWKRATRRQEDIEALDYEFNLCHNVANTARDIKAKAIIAYTQTGATPRMVSSFLPECPIYAITSTLKTFEQLSLIWNVMPILVENKKEPNDIIEKGLQIAKENGYINQGDVVVLAGGDSILSTYGEDKAMNRTIGGILKI